MRNPMVADKFYFLLGQTFKPNILVEVEDRPARAWCRVNEALGSADFQMFHHSAVDTEGFTIAKLHDIVESANTKPKALPPGVKEDRRK